MIKGYKNHQHQLTNINTHEQLYCILEKKEKKRNNKQTSKQVNK